MKENIVIYHILLDSIFSTFLSHHALSKMALSTIQLKLRRKNWNNDMLMLLGMVSFPNLAIFLRDVAHEIPFQNSKKSANSNTWVSWNYLPIMTQGMISYASLMFQNEGGITPFYMGVGTSAIQSATEKALYFFAYTFFKNGWVHDRLLTVCQYTTTWQNRCSCEMII